MNLDTFISILDTVAQVAGQLPFPWVAFGGVVLAAVAMTLRKYQQLKKAAPLAQVVELPVMKDVELAKPAQANAEAKQMATVTDIISKTLK